MIWKQRKPDWKSSSTALYVIRLYYLVLGSKIVLQEILVSISYYVATLYYHELNYILIREALVINHKV